MGLRTRDELERYQTYLEGGGKLDFRRWQDEGRPQPKPEPEPQKPIEDMTQREYEDYLLGLFNDLIKKGQMTIEEAIPQLQAQLRVFTQKGISPYAVGGTADIGGFYARQRREREKFQVEEERKLAFAQKWGLTEPGYRQRTRFFDPTRDIEFEPAIKEELAGFEGSRPWRDWFERSFPTFIQRFQRTLPEFTARWTGERISEEKKIQEKSWREFLREARTGFFDLSPYERGERPQVFQPSIRTVGF